MVLLHIAKIVSVETETLTDQDKRSITITIVETEDIETHKVSILKFHAEHYNVLVKAIGCFIVVKYIHLTWNDHNENEAMSALAPDKTEPFKIYENMPLVISNT